MTRPSLLGAALVALVCSSASAQAVDEGSFTITVRGERIGREDFSIRSATGAAGTTYLAQGTIAYGDRRIVPALTTDETGTPLGYVVDTRDEASAHERLKGMVSRGRMSVRVEGGRGETAREVVVPAGSVILDDDVMHQLYFVARRRAQGAVSVLDPRHNAQGTVRVSSRGADRVTIAGRSIAAEHLVIDGGETREMWVDAAGRVLKVAIPARALVAVRDDPPA